MSRLEKRVATLKAKGYRVANVNTVVDGVPTVKMVKGHMSNRFADDVIYISKAFGEPVFPPSVFAEPVPDMAAPFSL